MSKAFRAAPTTAILTVTPLLLMPTLVLAGAGGTEFDDVYTTLTDWLQGSLGRTIVLAIVGVGLVAGVMKQSLGAFATGIGGGIGAYNSPTIVSNIVTATLPTVPAITPMLGG